MTYRVWIIIRPEGFKPAHPRDYPMRFRVAPVGMQVAREREFNLHDAICWMWGFNRKELDLPIGLWAMALSADFQLEPGQEVNLVTPAAVIEPSLN